MRRIFLSILVASLLFGAAAAEAARGTMRGVHRVARWAKTHQRTGLTEALGNKALAPALFNLQQMSKALPKNQWRTFQVRAANIFRYAQASTHVPIWSGDRVAGMALYLDTTGPGKRRGMAIKIHKDAKGTRAVLNNGLGKETVLTISKDGAALMTERKVERRQPHLKFLRQ
ncbi:MAG: hypothetical protein JRH20_19815 [Deltaproteobacteria bacterium]|nr:hypothetical protein [Deltaproteobacteria bacterium]